MFLYALISGLETLLLGSFKTNYYGEGLKMFEEIASHAVHMLILLFWVTIVFIIISGVFWMRSNKKT
jgi:hypothetical protein